MWHPLVTEDSFLSHILPLLSRNNLLPGNDDAVAWKTPEGEDKSLVVLNTDSIAWSTDALPVTMSLHDFGMKLVTVTVSDVITKGAKPYYFLSTISIPQSFSDAQILELFEGLHSGCTRYHLEYMGGDLGQSKELVISGIVVGYVKEEYLLKRSTLGADDLICSTGYFGYTGLGFELYLENRNLSIPTLVQNLVEQKVARPQARLDWLPYLQKYATATIDSSDGLAISLHHLTKESGKQIILETLPAFPELATILEQDSDTYNWVILFAGEEFEILFSITKANYEKLLNEIEKSGLSKPVVLGRTTLGKPVVLYKGNELSIKNNWDSFTGFKK